MALLPWSILVILFGKRWFYKITIEEEKITYYYPIEVISKRTQSILFPKIEKIKYYGYAYNSPAHFTLLTKNKKYRFNCSEDEKIKLFEFFKRKNIIVDYHNENEVGFR